MAALWWGGSRRGRQPSHHGAFGRLSILSGMLSSRGAPVSNPALPFSHAPRAAASTLRSYLLTFALSLGLCV